MQENREFQNIKKQIQRICRNGKLQNKRIVLFGCIPGAKILRDELKRYHYSLSAIIDNNEKKIGKKCIGVTIDTPENYLGEFQDDVAVLIWSVYWREMLKQIESMGYVKDTHIFIFPEMRKSDDSLKTFLLNMTYVLKGYRICRKFQSKYRKNRWVFICPYPGTGDIYMAGGYFQNYIEREKIDNYIVLVMNKACSRVASLFQMENVKIISEKEKRYLMLAYDFFGPDKLHMKPLIFWGWRTKKEVLHRYCESINFNDMFKYDVYGMEIDSKRNRPVFLNDCHFIKDFFNRHNLIKGKTVIMAPYAGSFVSEISNSFWVRLAKELKNRGYSVCTNSAGDSEAVIKGTEPVFFDLVQTGPILDAAGYFIALRSGLCDIGSSSNCRKIVLYENGLTAAQYEYFSLKRMRLSDDAIEIIYNCENDDEFLGTVLKYFEIN